MKEVIKALKHIQDCIHEIKRDVESLQEDSGIQLGNSTFDYMDKAIDSLEKRLEIKKAELRVCQNEEHQIVYIDTIAGIGTEFATLDGFYCETCNSFWREP